MTDVRVLLTATQLRRRVPGGVGAYVRSLAAALVEERGIAPSLWTSRGRRGGEPLSSIGVPIVESRLPVQLLTRAWDRGYCHPPARSDVVHATSFAVPPRSRAPMTVMVHDLAWRAFPEAYPERGRRWHEDALERAVDRCDVLFTPSVRTANDLVASGVDRARVEVVPLGVDHLPDPDDGAARRFLSGLGVQGGFLLAVGTLEPRKNLARLFAAYERVRGDLPEPWPLVVVGPAGWGAEVAPVDGVVLAGAVPAPVITALYDRCALFVSVPLMEGFGLPALEAMSRGAAVVASAMPSAEEGTYRVDPVNTAAIAEGILRVASDEVLRDDLRRRGRRHAQGFTWAACARAHAAAWKRLA